LILECLSTGPVRNTLPTKFSTISHAEPVLYISSESYLFSHSASNSFLETEAVTSQNLETVKKDANSIF